MSPEDKYCPSCAAELAAKDVFGKERLACSQCGRVVYHDPKVAAIALVARDGRVLMIQRATKLGYGKWGLPGGFVDRGEVVEEAAAREVWEETGLEVRVDGLLGVYSQRGNAVIVAAFSAQETGGSLAPGPEALDAGFFAPDDLPELAFPRDTEILAKWRDGVDRSG